MNMASSVQTGKPSVIFILGGPGSGKGTQCSNLVASCGCVHLSAGELLREEQKKPGSEFGDLIEKHMVEGTIVPVEITCSLLERAIMANPKETFLIDGFPRNKDNLDGWNRIMKDRVNLMAVLWFRCEEKICIERCLKRGLAGSGRSDDNEASLAKRFQTYMSCTMPIIQHYQDQSLVKEIDTSRNTTEIFVEIEAIFKSLS